MFDLGRMIPIIVCDVISIVAVILRFWCKFVMKEGIHSDDWWTVVTVISFIGAEIALVWGVVKGNRDGRTIEEIVEHLQGSDDPVQRQELEIFLKSIFTAVTISFFVVFAIKIAILLLYKRIFSTPQYKRAALILMAISTVWFIVTEAINLAHCQPITIFWTDYGEGDCINFNLFFLVAGVFEIVIDVAILALPIVAVAKIQTEFRTKLIISGIFLVGGFAVITNVLRVAYTYQPNAHFVDLKDSELWTVIHVCASILCACLPVYRPVRAVFHRVYSRVFRSYASSRSYLSSLSAKGSSRDRGHDHDHVPRPTSYHMDSLPYNNSNSNNNKGQHRLPPRVYTAETQSLESTRDLLHLQMNEPEPSPPAKSWTDSQYQGRSFLKD